MVRNKSKRAKRLSAFVIGLFACLMVAPAGAMAGSSRHSDGRGDRSDRNHLERDRGHNDHSDKGFPKFNKHGVRHDKYARNDRHSDRRYERDHRRGGDNRHNGRNRQYRHNGHGKHYGHRDHYRHAGYSKHRRDVRYYCAPCNHYFDARDSFHAHLSGFHHIAIWNLPFVILQHALGWAFYG